MNSVTLDELKELEKSIKKELIIEYNGFIPKDKADLWLNNDYFNKSNYNSKKALSKYQGELLRHLFSDIIKVELKNNEKSKNLQEGLIEYYVEQFSNNKNIEINNRPDLKSKVKEASDIASKLGKTMDKLSFTGNYNDIIKALKETGNKVNITKSKDLDQKSTNDNENKENQIKSEEINMLDFIKPKHDETEKIEIDESDINNIISDVQGENNAFEKKEIEIENTIPVENNDIDYEKYEKTLEEGILEPIVEDNYELETPIELNENENTPEHKNDENYDFDKTGYIEVINEESYKENGNNDLNLVTSYEETNDNISEENDDFVPETTDEETNENISEDNNENNNALDNEEDNQNIETNDVTEPTDLEVVQDSKEEKNSEEKKENIYMIFYLFAITISVALIVGIILLKYYS